MRVRTLRTHSPSTPDYQSEVFGLYEKGAFSLTEAFTSFLIARLGLPHYYADHLIAGFTRNLQRTRYERDSGSVAGMRGTFGGQVC